MAEEVFENESFIAAPTKVLSPSEMTPLVKDVFPQASVRERVLSSQSMAGWERIGSDDEVDSEVIKSIYRILRYCHFIIEIYWVTSCGEKEIEVLSGQMVW